MNKFTLSQLDHLVKNYWDKLGNVRRNFRSSWNNSYFVLWVCCNPYTRDQKSEIFKLENIDFAMCCSLLLLLKSSVIGLVAAYARPGDTKCCSEV